MAEYTVIDTPPLGSANVYTDGVPIILGNCFHLLNENVIELDDAYVVGGRVWTPGGITGNTQLNVYLYDIPNGDFVHPIKGRSPLRQTTATITPGGWTEARFDEPWKIPDLQTPWCIAYSGVQNNRYYSAVIGGRVDPDQVYAANLANGLVLGKASTNLKPGVVAWVGGYYYFPNTDVGERAGSTTTTYAVDTIVSDSLAAEDSWSLWNGSVEVPVTPKLWTGSAESDFTTEVAT